MRKKWFRLLVLPLFLVGAIFWVQKARWKRVEGTFREALVREYATPGAIGIEVSVGNARRKQRLGFLSQAEVKALAPHLFLRPSAPPLGPSKATRLYFVGELIDFNIVSGDKSDGPNGGSMREEWRGQWMELTPGSARLLRQRFRARWARRIAEIERAP